MIILNKNRKYFGGRMNRKINLSELKQIIKNIIKENSEESAEHERETIIPNQYRYLNINNYDASLEQKFKERFEKIELETLNYLKNANLGNFAIVFGNPIQSKSEILAAINPSKYSAALFKYILFEKENNNKSLIQILDPKQQIPSYYLNEIINSYVGMISFKKYSKDCYGAYGMNLVAAQHGFGPILYSIVASYVKTNGGKYNKIMADRGSVETAAINIWKNNYHNRINDYNIYELDNFKPPFKTPNYKWDDCVLHIEDNLEDNKYLNYAYKIKTPLKYKIFEDKFEHFLDEMMISINQLEASYNSNELRNLLKQFIIQKALKYFEINNP
jgi:hypothetical protein